jgi:hypothetical protein
MTKKKTQSLTREELVHEADYNKWLKADDPLPYVVLSVAFIEQSLRIYLANTLTKGETSKSLLDNNGPLGSFKAKADLCYALGIIPKKLFQVLGAIGEIRNKFAHSHKKLSFESVEIRALIDGNDGGSLGLAVPQNWHMKTNSKGAAIGFGMFRTDPRWGLPANKSSEPKLEPRRKFDLAIVFAEHILHNLIVIQQENRKLEVKPDYGAHTFEQF